MKMEYSDSDLQKYQKIAFDYALYRTGNIPAAEDISSQTISLFLLSFNNRSDARRWIINTSKNYCKKFFAKMKKEEKEKNTYREDMLQRISNHPGYEKDGLLHDAFKESFKSLNDMELKTIFYYFQCNENFKEMHSNIGGSYDALRKQISRIKNKLKAETFKRLGYIGSKRIVTPQLNNLIIKFLRRFKKNLEAGTIEKMYYYFSKVDLKNYNPTYEIKEILEYDIDLNDSIYKAWIFFKNKHNVIDSFSIDFFVDDKNHLKIVTPPTKTKKIVIIEPESEEGKQIKKLLDTYPIGKSGRPKIPEEEMDKIIKQFEEKQKN
jgi:DNA-directed RNA polymerase specialized sigma24 family protein